MTEAPARPPARRDLRAAVAGLFPGSFALVMATGIVSIAAHLQGFPTAARALLWANAAAYGVLLTAISAAVFLAWGREREPA